jgi:hypothetical protein
MSEKTESLVIIPETQAVSTVTVETLATFGFKLFANPVGRDLDPPPPGMFVAVSRKQLEEASENLKQLLAFVPVNDPIAILKSHVDIAAAAKAINLARLGERIAIAMDVDGIFYATY